MSRLEEIIAYKRKEIEPWLTHTEDWGNRAATLHPYRGFRKSLASGEFGFVGEVKRASPSAGVIAENFFQGHLDSLALIRHRLLKPILRKDFTLHEVQIYQAALAGADAVLLIVAALTDDELKRLKTVADQIGIDCLVEVHDETELDRALGIGAAFIGINNRNLATFELDLNVTERLAPKIPSDCTIVSESGIRTAADVRRVVAAGAHAALIGESLMRAPDPGAL